MFLAAGDVMDEDEIWQKFRKRLKVASFHELKSAKAKLDYLLNQPRTQEVLKLADKVIERFLAES